jgi:hypothetical protein
VRHRHAVADASRTRVSPASASNARAAISAITARAFFLSDAFTRREIAERSSKSPIVMRAKSKPSARVTRGAFRRICEFR